jgi:bifunctional enzyme CysN/CysC
MMTDLFWHANAVSKKSRSELKTQTPKILWFTGLSGSGKSTIANAVEIEFLKSRKHTYILDGDNVRQGLNRDLGFSDSDRIENLRRVAEVAKLMSDAGLIVIVSFISPFLADRKLARELMEPGEFFEIYVDTPFTECVRRDPKGLYKRALAGKLENFTGVSSVYEPPLTPDIRLDTLQFSAVELAQQVVKFVLNK